jgi:HAD superfamily phosphatase
MLDEYHRVDIQGRTAYIRRNGIFALRNVSTVLFDCDGVLIDARDSYNHSISMTVSYLSSIMLRTKVPQEAISERVIHSFRNSGGFNNDWDTTYAILLYLFTRLSQQAVDRLRVYSSSLGREESSSPSERISKCRRLLAGIDNSRVDPDDFEESLLKLAKRADSRGLDSIEEALSKNFPCDALNSFASLVSHPGDVGISVVTTVFEEIFLGPSLFYLKYHIESHFVKADEGLVTREKPIVTEKTLKFLRKRFTASGLGIVSGRSLITAEYTLGALLKYFNHQMIIFVEDEISNALGNGEAEEARVIGKPNPYGLLKAEGVSPSKGRILYVGDSKEDLIMVGRANHISDRFIAAGVYGCASFPEEQIRLFMEDSVYLIAASVNDLYSLFKTVDMGEGD